MPSIGLISIYGFPGGSDGKECACNARDPGSVPGSGRSPGGGNGRAHSSILAWEIPWTEEAGRLQCVGMQSRAGRSTHKPSIRRSPKSLRQEVAEQGLAPRSFNC